MKDTLDCKQPIVRRSSDLEVCSSLESLFADAADVAAVLAVSLFAVPPQRVGVLAQLVTVITLVPAFHVQLGVFPTFSPISRILDL